MHHTPMYNGISVFRPVFNRTHWSATCSITAWTAGLQHKQWECLAAVYTISQTQAMHVGDSFRVTHMTMVTVCFH